MQLTVFASGADSGEADEDQRAEEVTEALCPEQSGDVTNGGLDVGVPDFVQNMAGFLGKLGGALLGFRLSSTTVSSHFMCRQE